MTTSFRIDDNIKKEHLPGRDIRTKKGRQDRIAETLTLNESFMKDPFQNPSRQHIEKQCIV